MVKGNRNGQMEIMKGVGKKVTLTATVYFSGVMVESTKENGKEEICMEKGNMYGQMVDVIMVNIRKSKGTALENSIGQTDGNMKGIGRRT